MPVSWGLITFTSLQVGTGSHNLYIPSALAGSKKITWFLLLKLIKDLIMHIHFKKLLMNKPGNNFQMSLDVSPFYSQSIAGPASVHPCATDVAFPALPPGSPPPHAAQPGLAEGEVGSVQSWLTLYWAALLILHYDYWPPCPANSLRPKFLCVKRRADRLRAGGARQTPVLFFAGSLHPRLP